MFPTISHIIKYFTGIFIPLPISTLGFFILLSFIGAYRVFTKELKRKEKTGIILPFTKTTVKGKPASIPLLFLYGIAGFFAGYKLVYGLLNYRLFAINPQDFIFSRHGNMIGGIIVGVFFAGIIYFQKKQNQSAKPQVVTEIMHPYQLMDKLLLWCGLIGFAGAIILGKLEHIDGMIKDPVAYFSSFNGLAYYGGLIFGAATYFYITKKAGISLINAADIGSPGMILAYGIGRIGCQLSGDGDWGIVNMLSKPKWLSWMPNWMWAFNFPHNVLRQGKFIRDCTDNSYCTELTYPVFPTSFYESVICLLFFVIIWSIRNKIKTPGLMFSLFALFCGIERFFIEMIRVNPKYHFMGLYFTQAELISIILFLTGLFVLFIIKKNKVVNNTILKQENGN